MVNNIKLNKIISPYSLTRSRVITGLTPLLLLGICTMITACNSSVDSTSNSSNSNSSTTASSSSSTDSISGNNNTHQFINEANIPNNIYSYNLRRNDYLSETIYTVETPYGNINIVTNLDFNVILNKEISKKLYDKILNTAIDLANNSVSGETELETIDKLGDHSNVRISSYGTVENILSVFVEISWETTADDDPKASKYFFDSQIINVDMSTGEDVELSDIFIDGFDYIGLANKNISMNLFNKLNDGWIYGGMQNDFKGVAANQEFYINKDYGIVICKAGVRDASGAFGLGGGYSMAGEESLAISFEEVSGKVNIFDKYKADKSLTNKENVALVLMSKLSRHNVVYSPKPAKISDDYYIEYLVENIKNAPATIKDKIASYEAPQYIDDYILDRKQETSEIYYKFTVDVDYYGNFLIVDVDESLIKWGGEGKENDSKSNRHVHILDDKTGEEIEFSNLFIEGFDYKTISMNALAEEYEKTFKEPLSNTYPDINALKDRVTYTVTPTSIGIEFKDNDTLVNGKRREVFVYAEVNYEELGLENLMFVETSQ